MADIQVGLTYYYQIGYQNDYFDPFIHCECLYLLQILKMLV